MPQEIQEGPAEASLEKALGQIGIVSVHCWNLGEPDGPYPIEPGIRSPGKVEDWVPLALKIVNSRISPVFAAARRAQIPIFHLGVDTHARRYPTHERILSDPDLRPPETTEASLEICINPRTKEERLHDLFGPEWPGAVWNTHPESFDIATAVRPLPDEAVVTDGWQLNGLCRRLGIDTLFYVGFMADICIEGVPGAMREMAEKFRYRTVILRDRTLAYEYPETHEEQWMTFAAIRNIETDIGFSTTSREFIDATEAVALLSGGKERRLE
jgi:nicotinamidase-related amidase